MGIKETVMIRSEKKSAGTTSFAASVITYQRGQHSHPQHDYSHKRRPEMEKEDYADQRHDDRFFYQFFFQRVDRPVDEVAPVVNRPDRPARRQARLQFLELLLNSMDGIEGVLAEAHYNDASDCPSLPARFGHPPSFSG